MTRLQKGDVFFLGEKHFVMMDSINREVGKVYQKKTDFSKERAQLKSEISALLYKKGIKHDYDIVKRFVEYVAKDQPASTFKLEQGHFVVTGIESRDSSNEETVHCTRFSPEPGQIADEIQFYQNRHGRGDYPFNVLFTLPPV